jgi:hypothetical protein
MRWGKMRKTINVKNWKLMMDHTLYGPYTPPPSDFYMFGPMKEALRGRSHWRGAKLAIKKNLWKAGIGALKSRGDYVER